MSENDVQRLYASSMRERVDVIKRVDGGEAAGVVKSPFLATCSNCSYKKVIIAERVPQVRNCSRCHLGVLSFEALEVVRE